MTYGQRDGQTDQHQIFFYQENSCEPPMCHVSYKCKRKNQYLKRHIVVILRNKYILRR
jgi:hypothetical protein